MQIIITIANLSNYKIPVSIYFEFYTSVYYLVHLREPLPKSYGENVQYLLYTPRYKSVVLHVFMHIFIHICFFTYNTQYCSNLHGWYYFLLDLLCQANEAVSPTPDLPQHEHLRILHCMHLCVNIDMHDLMYTCDVHMNQRIQLIVIHGTLSTIAARYSC